MTQWSPYRGNMYHTGYGNYRETDLCRGCQVTGIPTATVSSASTDLRGLCVQSRYGTYMVALPEETGSNRENKPVPKTGEAYFYSTIFII